MAAVISALLALATAHIARAANPGQIVTAAAAAGALAANYSRPRSKRVKDQLTIRLLLSVNLATFAVVSWTSGRWLAGAALVIAVALFLCIVLDSLVHHAHDRARGPFPTTGEAMLTPFQRQDLDLFNDPSFQETAKSVSADLAGHLDRVNASASENNMTSNDLGESNEQLVEALERFAARPGASHEQSQQATQLAERIRSALSAAERP